MAPIDRPVPRFVAEPPQDLLPYGRWAATLRERFLAACQRIDAEGEDLGDPQEVLWFPDRTFNGRTYVPATARTTTGHELFGHVSFIGAEEEDGTPEDFGAVADATDETADRHPEWKLDLCDDVVGRWRGQDAEVAEMTLVWGVPTVPGGAVVTADLGGQVVDQCRLVEERFTLLAPDGLGDATLDVRLYDDAGRELAMESLYEEGDEDEGA
jgi:hypothetical protein